MTTASTAASGTHTPGPWEFEEDDRYGSVYGEDPATGLEWSICDVGPPIELICNAAEHVSQEIRDQAYANARLIAAAPDLLEMAIWAEAAIAPFSKEPQERSGILRLRAAIAKALGS